MPILLPGISAVQRKRIFFPGPSGTPPPPAFSNIDSVFFDGVDSYVNVGAAMHPEYTDAFSVSAWMYLKGINYPGICGNIGPAPKYRGFVIGVHGAGKMYVQLNSDYSLGQQLYFLGATSPTLNVWTHVVFTYNGNHLVSGCKIYLNSVSDTKNTQVDGLGANTIVSPVNSELGRDGSGFSGYFSGNLDEVSYWNTALTAPQVSEIYNSGSPANLAVHSASANLVNWWRMGDGDTYPTLIDVKSASNGTMINMAAGDIVAVVP